MSESQQNGSARSIAPSKAEDRMRLLNWFRLPSKNSKGSTEMAKKAKVKNMERQQREAGLKEKSQGPLLLKSPDDKALASERKLRVFVNSAIDNGEYGLMRRCGIDKADGPDDADILFFVGGSDVNPMLYGEQVIKGTYFNEKTDERDLKGWRMARDKFKIGVCRGGQFLNVMNGGKLWQDVDNHDRSHKITDRFTGQQFMVSSTHHQQFRPANTAIVIATARETSRKQCDQSQWFLKNSGTAADDFFKIDHEVLWYPESRSLCFQPHPEYSMPVETEVYFRNVLWKCLRNQYPLDKRGAGSFLDQIKAERKAEADVKDIKPL